MTTSFFDSLPPEIVNKILCFLEYEELCALKHVCSNWARLIEDIVLIESLPVPKSTRFQEVYKYRAKCSIKNMINNLTFIKRQTNISVLKIYHIKYTQALDILFRECVFVPGCDDYIGYTWRVLLDMLDEDYTVDELRNKYDTDEYVRSFMEKYTWYFHESEDTMDFTNECALIALYPDCSTFSIGDYLSDEIRYYPNI